MHQLFTKNDIFRHKITWLVIAIAAALQIQFTIFKDFDYAGLRVNLADLMLPAFGLLVLTSLALKKTRWPQWDLRFTPYWLGALCIVFTLSLYNGYLYTNEFSSWAAINKYAGLFALIAYFLLGSWFATNFQNTPRVFFSAFCAVFTGILFLSVIAALAKIITPTAFWINDFPWDGFMANRNAYMLVWLFCLIAFIFFDFSEKQILPSCIVKAFWIMAPFFAFFNASRTAWVLGAAILVVITVVRPIKSLQKIWLFLAKGLIFLVILQLVAPIKHLPNDHQWERITSLKAVTNYEGDQKRFLALQDGLELFKESNPLIGGGLGSYKEFQEKKYGEFIDIIDCTPLWLLVETGLVGALVFGAFFLMALHRTYLSGFKGSMNSERSMYSKITFFFLIVFFISSFVHEIMYSRFVWFTLGLIVVIPTTRGGQHNGQGIARQQS